MNFYYDKAATLDSSVLDSAYYDRDGETLVVVLYSGTKAGYVDVPEIVYTSLVNADSPGRYWNLFIKNNYTGYDTAYISGFEPFKHGEGLVAQAPVVDNTKAAPVVPAGPKRRFEVGYSFNYIDVPAKLTVWAVDNDAALTTFSEVVRTLGWNSVVVRYLTQFFN